VKLDARGVWAYLLNILEFVYYVSGLSLPIRPVVQLRSFARRRVQTMCKTICWVLSDIFHKNYLHAGVVSQHWRVGRLLAGCI